MKDLTQSAVDRQNILNNQEALAVVQKHLNIKGLLYQGELLFTTKMVADFYHVTTRTIKNLLSEFEDEVKHNGYQVIKGQKLKEFKEMFGPLLTSEDEVSQRGADSSISK